MPVLEAPRCALHFGETEAAANRVGKPNLTRIESFGFRLGDAYPLSRAGYCEVVVAWVVGKSDGEVGGVVVGRMMTVRVGVAARPAPRRNHSRVHHASSELCYLSTRIRVQLDAMNVERS